MQVIFLQEVVIVLEGGVEVHTPATVFPESEGAGYNLDLFLLDVSTLRRGDMVQIFGGGGSGLIIRRPDLLRTLPDAEEPPKVYTFKVRQAGRKTKPISVLLDTGSRTFSVSRRWERRNRRRGVGKVENVFLKLGGDCCLHAKRPNALDSHTQDMVIGRRQLRKYNAIVDYGNESICFEFGHKLMKIDLVSE